MSSHGVSFWVFVLMFLSLTQFILGFVVLQFPNSLKNQKARERERGDFFPLQDLDALVDDISIAAFSFGQQFYS